MANERVGRKGINYNNNYNNGNNTKQYNPYIYLQILV